MRASSARRPLSGPVAAVVLALLVTGCSEEKKAAPAPAPTPIARLDTAAMQVPRIEFCTLVPSSAVADALGGEPESDTAYGNGDEEQLPGMGSDVVHEIGCSWVGEDGAAARAWVFARPVDPAFARSVIASTRKARGCRRVPGPAYGTPSVTQLCRLPGGGQRVRHAGLFGQTWLTCELAATAPEPELRARTDAWCVEVAGALDTAR